MSAILSLTKRNCKLFFKDKGLFLTSLITPLILLVLYASFLSNVYKDVFSQILVGLDVPEKIINGAVVGQLTSSLLAVCCVTVSFCSNLLMLQDKVNGVKNDLLMTPATKTQMAISYYFSTVISTLLICYTAMSVCIIYCGIVGFYMTLLDVFLIVIDVLILTLFGTTLSSLITFPLSSIGQGSAVGSIVSSCYGFICGAYMPISQFPVFLQRVLSFLPGTYGTALLRTHAMQGAFNKMAEYGVPKSMIDEMAVSLDLKILFFDNQVSTFASYLILIGATLLILGLYVFVFKKSKKER